MGKSKLCTSIIIGSIVGGLIAMSDPKVRQYTKQKINDISTNSSRIIKNPSETINKARLTFDQLSERITSGTDRAIRALETVEQTLNKISEK